MKIALSLLLLAACAPAVQTPPTVPPPPVRPANAAVAFGVVADASGGAVGRARVTAWAADAACATAGNAAIVVTGTDGTYEVRVEQGVGPQFDGCIVVEAAAGGAVAREQRNVHYAPDTAGGNRVRIDLVLPPVPELDREEADRIVLLVVAGVRNDDSAVRELALYAGRDVPETWAWLSPFAQATRGVDRPPRLLSQSGRTFTYELTGRRPGTSLRVVVAQDTLTRVEIAW